MGDIVLFDFDGVIADSLDIFFEVFTNVCAEMGYDRLNSKEAFLRLFEGNPIGRLLWAGFPLFRPKQLARRFRPRLEEANARVPPFPEMPETLAYIARRCPVYVVTSNVSQTIEGFLKKYQIEGIRGIAGVEHESSKVKKIRRILKQHPGSKAFYIGDTKGDMIEARRAGAIPVAVTWGWHSAATLREGNPEHVVDSPAELRALVLRKMDAVDKMDGMDTVDGAI
jgi:phosphoglycolate phosphatase